MLVGGIFYYFTREYRYFAENILPSSNSKSFLVDKATLSLTLPHSYRKVTLCIVQCKWILVLHKPGDKNNLFLIG